MQILDLIPVHSAEAIWMLARLPFSPVGLLISATPLGQTAFARSIGFGAKSKQSNSPYVCWWCNLVNSVAASADSRRPSQDVVTWLLDQAEDGTLKKPDPNESSAHTQPTQHE